MPEQLFKRGYTEKINTLRGVVSGARRAAPTAYLNDIRSSPLLPMDSTAQQEAIGRGVSVDYQFYCDPGDIIPEDRVVFQADLTRAFVVVEVAPWPVIDPRVLHITVREYQGD